MTSEQGSIDHYSFLAGKHWLADPAQALLMARPRRTLIDKVLEREPQRVLDVCCGSGAVASRLTRLGIDTTGVDGSATMLQRARDKQRLRHTLQMDVTEMAFDAEFDAAYISLAIHEMSPAVRTKVWQNMCQAVRPGGRLVVLDFCVAQRRTLWSRIWSGFTELDERNFLKTNPPHYHHYREFMQNGGVHGWLQGEGARIEDSRHHLGGSLAVVTVAR